MTGSLSRVIKQM